jgi:hypothetical protein
MIATAEMETGIAEDLAQLRRGLEACRPPSEKALEAMRLIDVEQRSTREAAEKVGVSQTRVRQLADQARGFLVGMSPAVKDDGLLNQQLHVAEALQLERLKYLYRLAMRSFRRSCGVRTTVRVVPDGLGTKETEITTDSYGDVRYLAMAMRISGEMAKVPDSGLLNRAWLAAAGEAGEEGLQGGRDEEVGEERAGEESGVMKGPPVGDCSGAAQQAAVRDGKGAVGVDVNDAMEATWEEIEAEFEQWKRDNLPPAQLSAAQPTDQVPLNRKERRARQRELEKVRRKAR